ncbi:uncharacterized protein F4822DRAFT_429086 [Hypoxylon trugodes]|uniref:uncharacterized protein n=1 Tax=Hypoxylon trugodes TaxID=326681 RepID=UPI00218C9CB8|nr:uncharacterized protein F4822DRAFT_429086 [Hypoxylon trugodes]KAI1388462.1 hypothetical protein F4822DRAFT_429086 [Hypoxylon trugodes]
MPKRRSVMITDEEREDRAARKRLRTTWVTDATPQEKSAAINLAVGRLGGKKYSWMDQSAGTGSGARDTTPDSTFSTGAASPCLDLPISPATSNEKSPEKNGDVEESEDGKKDNETKKSKGTKETPQKPIEEGTLEKPIELSSGPPSPIVISSQEGSPAPKKAPRGKTPSKTPTKKAEEKKDAKITAPKAIAEETEEVVYEDPKEEEEDLLMFLEYAWNFIAG